MSADGDDLLAEAFEEPPRPGEPPSPQRTSARGSAG